LLIAGSRNVFFLADLFQVLLIAALLLLFLMDLGGLWVFVKVYFLGLLFNALLSVLYSDLGSWLVHFGLDYHRLLRFFVEDFA
jgi:hypothetical protein